MSALLIAFTAFAFAKDQSVDLSKEAPAWAKAGVALHYDAAISPAMLSEPLEVEITQLGESVGEASFDWTMPKRQASGQRDLDGESFMMMTLFLKGEKGKQPNSRAILLEDNFTTMIARVGHCSKSCGVNGKIIDFKYLRTKQISVEIDGTPTQLDVLELAAGKMQLDVLASWDFPLVTHYSMPMLRISNPDDMDVHAVNLKRIVSAPPPPPPVVEPPPAEVPAELPVETPPAPNP